MFTRILFYKREEYARIDGLVQARLPEIKSTDGLVANSRPTHNHTDTRGGEWRFSIFPLGKIEIAQCAGPVEEEIGTKLNRRDTRLGIGGI
jgi:hypothetical protein